MLIHTSNGANWTKKIGLLLLFAFVSLPSLAEQKILILGDSLSAGYGIEVDEGWVNLLQNQLNESGPEVTLINASISGETARGGALRLPSLLSQHNPDVVVIELGANDGLRGYPLARIQQQVEQLVQTSLNAKAKVLLVGIRLPPNLGDAYNEPFFNQYQLISSKYNTAYMPFLLEDVALRSEWMQSDGLHPTAEAQPTIALNVSNFLLPLLK